MNLGNVLARKLIAKKKTLSLAESCSGGLLSNRITDIPGSSKFFKLGLVTYSNEAKVRLLNVPKKILAQHGAVSEPTARTMAKGVRKILKTDYSIAITGIAGPSGATLTKPIGLTFIAIDSSDKTLCQKFVFKGSRLKIKSQAVTCALRLLLKLI